VKNVI